MAFRFKEKSTVDMYAMKNAKNMQHFHQPEWILSGDELLKERDDLLVEECIAGLRVDNWRAMVSTQDTNIVPGGAFTEKESWYGIEYHVQDVRDTLLQVIYNLLIVWISLDSSLSIPNFFFFWSIFRDWPTLDYIQICTSQFPTHLFPRILKPTNLQSKIVPQLRTTRT